MAKKENRGGLLRNEQIEADRKAKGKAEEPLGYAGAQDNGDAVVRTSGNEVQQRDGFDEKGQQGGEE